MNKQDVFYLKEAGVQDVSTIRQIAAKAFPATYASILSTEQLEWMFDWMYSEQALTTDISNNTQRFYLAFWMKKPCGYISISTPSKDLHISSENVHASASDLDIIQSAELPIYKLNKIYLSPDFQGKGLGRRLWEEAVAIVRGMSKEPCRMILQVNRHNLARNFYEHLGMTCIAEEDFILEHGYEMNDYVMAIDVK